MPVDECVMILSDYYFVRAWRTLSDAGAADGWGGAQCRRMAEAWIRAGRPKPYAWLCEALGEDDRAGPGPAAG